MASKSIGWVTRDSNNDNVKTGGGNFGGAIDMETVERLAKAHFTVEMRPSGSPVFVDREGRQVRLYLSIDPRTTEEGKRLLKLDAERRRAAENALDARLSQLLHGMSTEEVIRRLEGNT